MTATLPAQAPERPQKPRTVMSLYKRLAANRAKLTKAEAARESVAADRADLWRALIAEGETHVSIAAASGVHKTYIKKELERRALRG